VLVYTHFVLGPEMVARCDAGGLRVLKLSAYTRFVFEPETVPGSEAGVLFVPINKVCGALGSPSVEASNSSSSANKAGMQSAQGTSAESGSKPGRAAIGLKSTASNSLLGTD
jgi:hypothetical protein